MKFNSPITYLRIYSLLDACSYIYLLYCAIYLKRVLGDESAIRVPGMIHGFIFCLFGVALIWTTISKRWHLKTFFLVGITSLIPFLPFWLESWLKKQYNS